MGYGSFSLVRKCAAQNESEKKKSFYFPELYDDETAKNEKKKNLEKLVQLELHSGKMDETF